MVEHLNFSTASQAFSFYIKTIRQEGKNKLLE